MNGIHPTTVSADIPHLPRLLIVSMVMVLLFIILLSFSLCLSLPQFLSFFTPLSVFLSPSLLLHLSYLSLSFSPSPSLFSLFSLSLLCAFTSRPCSHCH